MKNNGDRRVTSLVGISLILLMLMVPPWRSGDYSFFLIPPAAGAEIDVVRLLLQVLIVFVLTAAILVMQTDSVHEDGGARRSRIYGSVFVGLIIISAIWGSLALNERRREGIAQESKVQQATLQQSNALKVEQKNRELIRQETSLARLAAPRKWEEVKRVCPGVNGTVWTSWTSGKLHYRIHLTGHPEDLEFARASHHVIVISLFSQTRRSPLCSISLPGTELKSYNAKGKIYAVGSDQLSVPLAQESYEHASDCKIHIESVAHR